MLKRISVAGLHVTAATKPEVLEEIERRLSLGGRTVIVTPYSEFLYAGLKDSRVMAMLNKADIAIPDGIGILWAATFLAMPVRFKGKIARALAVWWQVVLSGARILYRPRTVKATIPEKIVGADCFWDLAGLARKNNKSIFLLGGHQNTAELVTEKLTSKYPGIHIAGSSNKDWDDSSLVEDVKNACPDFLFVALGPIRQERWIFNHLDELPSVRIAIGLGGTFDYVAGKKTAPPKIIRAIGLEWLYRLLTQPSRYKRIYYATFGLIYELVKYKLSRESHK